MQQNHRTNLSTQVEGPKMYYWKSKSRLLLTGMPSNGVVKRTRLYFTNLTHLWSKSKIFHWNLNPSLKDWRRACRMQIIPAVNIWNCSILKLISSSPTAGKSSKLQFICSWCFSWACITKILIQLYNSTFLVIETTFQLLELPFWKSRSLSVSAVVK